MKLKQVVLIAVATIAVAGASAMSAFAYASADGGRCIRQADDVTFLCRDKASGMYVLAKRDAAGKWQSDEVLVMKPEGPVVDGHQRFHEVH